MLDEVPVAYVVLEPGLDDERAITDLTAWSERSLSPSKRPRAFRTVKELPRTSVGKIRKVSLRTASPSGPSAAGGAPW